MKLGFASAILPDLSLEEVLTGWNAETPVPDEVRQQVRGELDRAGLTGRAGRDDRLAG